MIPKTMSSNPYDKEMQFKLDFFFYSLRDWIDVNICIKMLFSS